MAKWGECDFSELEELERKFEKLFDRIDYQKRSQRAGSDCGRSGKCCQPAWIPPDCSLYRQYRRNYGVRGINDSEKGFGNYH